MLHEVNRNLFHAMYRSCKGFTAPFSLNLHSDHEVIAVNCLFVGSATINRKATVLTVEDNENELMEWGDGEVIPGFFENQLSVTVVTL